MIYLIHLIYFSGDSKGPHYLLPAMRAEIYYKMPTYIDIVRFESESPAGTIRLVRSGEFYRAYNRSAWLFYSCVAEHKVMRKYIKALKDDVYYIGFPEKSLFNNIGERCSIKTDYGFDIELRADEIPQEDGYERWKSTIDTNHASKGDFHSLPLAGADAEREVIRRLKDFNIESKTMVECTVFLAELRGLLSNH